ncbi:chemotaxis protein cheA [Azoarcus olearius]|uniref:chemotaxis protein CheA n=1 Tax=Azoarcus sp. (strain BH72) TaxID=418699 RepID=UPI0008061D12|nr:chemotaxis protein CheA [Azoarcus olearius]ANQ84619.1 chemotaxis protein cheA [Azoarcus olearius]
MAFDMSQFYQIFFEEAAEHLATIETVLLSIDAARPDPEKVAEIFRAAHSIKGSAATFGFDDLTGLTHEMESLLDDVRRGRRPLTQAMVQACLAAGDALHGLLAAHRGEGVADRAAAEAARQRLLQLKDAPDHDGAVTDRPAAAVPDATEWPLYRVRFVVARFLAGSDLLFGSMLEDLAALGDYELLEPDPAAPGTRCIRICSGESVDALRAAFERLAEPGSVEITAEQMAAANAAPALPEPQPPAVAAAGDEALFDVADDGSYGFFVPLETLPAAPFGADDPPAAAVPDEADAQPAATARELPRSADSSIRVGVERVDRMMDLVGELVITQSMLLDAAAAIGPAAGERLLAGLALLQRHTRDLQQSVMAIRMVPVSMVFSRFPRLVHDLGMRLDKQIDLVLEGEHTELDKGLVEKLADPLTHLVRNCIDHGIEPAERRRAAGKPEAGRLRLAASHLGGHVLIEVEDDGAGLDRERLIARARAQGLPCSEDMSDEEAWQLIFLPGFSTAEQVTDLSGRGVGMDVVRRNIAALGGRVDIVSRAGRGTRFSVSVPLTLAILEGMQVAVGDEVFILPLDAIVESLQPEPASIRSIGGAPRLIAVRGEYWPVVELGHFFAVPEAGRDWTRGIMVLVERNGSRAALFVDGLVGQQQVVIKPLETHFRRVPGVSSATLLGDGRVALILDVAALIGTARDSAAI